MLAIGVGSVAFADRDSSSTAPTWQAGAAAHASPATQPAGATSAAPAPSGATFTLSAVGDIVMSNAPGGLPPNNGDGFFDDVKTDLKSDLVMGNLEQPLTDDTGTSKCGDPARPNCFAFRSPPAYAQHLKEGGFDLVNTANNHNQDFGTAGAVSTRQALDAAGVKYTGQKDQITLVTVNGIKIAVLGFSPYAGNNNLNDYDHTKDVIQQAKSEADVVIVQVHMGAEGATMQHVKPGNEIFHGENRGDPIKFSHAAIDDGADIVIGHSPHVLRAMEFYKGHLIAYSLGNFAGAGHTLSSTGVLKYGGILHVTLTGNGGFVSGKFQSTVLSSQGLPTRDDTNEEGRQLVSQLTQADFPQTGAVIGTSGSITPPA